jgi:hypothetical protein
VSHDPRVCTADGCKTILSRFNADDRCWQHEYGPIERPASAAAKEQVRRCWRCFAPLIGKTEKARFCNDICAQRSYYQRQRRIVAHALAAARRGRVCEECGDEIPVTKKRYKAKILTCSIRCYQRKYQRERQRRVHGWKPRRQEPMAYPQSG